MAEKPWKHAMDLDSALHTPARIAILLFLIPRGTATFPVIQKALNVTAGNLSSHLRKLEEASYIVTEKKFVENKPTTIISISSVGYRSIVDYIKILNSAIDTNQDQE